VKVFGLKECADYLGMNYSTLSRLIKKGRGPRGYNIGQLGKHAYLRFTQEEVDRWRIQQTEAWQELAKTLKVADKDGRVPHDDAVKLLAVRGSHQA
jgi:predicted DNA-binding transcriptional regulator AlpA